MEKPSAPDDLPLVSASPDLGTRPYDHIRAYNYLLDMGLTGISKPKLVDDPVLDRQVDI